MVHAKRVAASPRVAVVTLYGKPGCHLCDSARVVVQRVRAEHPFELREVDVSLDPQLHREYGERIPVLALDGEELFDYFVEEAVLVARLDRVDGS
jgi:glutaredoxin